MSDSFFTSSDGEWFVATDRCRGPWDADACHAGPPTGLMARALEREAAHHRLTRLTVDLTTPIPMGGFRIETATERQGRSVTITTGSIIDADGRVRATARGLHLAVAETSLDLPTVDERVAHLAEAVDGAFPVGNSLHGLPGFRTGVETRFPPGDGPTPGPTVMWMRTVPLLAGEVPSPFQRICPLADCGNAASRNAEIGAAQFINPDLTLVVHRDPVGEWLGMSARSHWQATGVGLADALLFDDEGLVGRAMQTLLVRPAPIG